MKKWCYLFCGLLLSGCATKDIIPAEEYDPTKHARIRIFAFNGNGAGFYVGMDCKENPKGTHIMAARLDKLLGVGQTQKRIGMTQTRASDIAQTDNYIFSEYVIPAGKPVNILPALTRFKTSCPTAGKPCTVTSEDLCQRTTKPSKVRTAIYKITTFGIYDGDGSQSGDERSFIPQAGKQYEYIPSGCKVNINDITEEEIQPVSLNKVYRCE
ncbi:hypothetical protein [Bibersteinia trehalosi]|uniref:hypothetical protein n=1 Tax=Bibersteinia trehalosi TaxID=47735 RepID=UPI002D77906A|nr:hypothetical protein [Bibersteinia trehalosi]